MSEITRVEWQPEAAQNAVDTGQRRGLERAADTLLSAAERIVPRRTGALAASAHVAINEDGVAVSYGERYARVLYAHPEWDYHGKSGRWLDDALHEQSDRMLNEIADALRAEIEGA